MKLFDELTVTEFLTMLQDLTRQNAKKIKKNNLKAFAMPSPSLRSKEENETKTSLFQQNAEITKENVEFIELHAKLVDFFKKYADCIEIQHEESTQEVGEEVQTCAPTKQKAGNNNSLFNLDIEQLNALMNEKIRQELYEECQEIKEAINQKLVKTQS